MHTFLILGWLEVVAKNGAGRGHHNTIHDVVATGCKYFLTRTTLLGFKVQEDEENGLQVGRAMTYLTLKRAHPTVINMTY